MFRQNWTCVHPTGSQADEGVSYFMVAHCSEGYDEPAVRAACENVAEERSQTTLDSLVFIMPVTVNGTAYRNAFCAVCNDANDSSQYVNWTPGFRCDKSDKIVSPATFLSVLRNLTTTKKKSLIESRCRGTFFNPPPDSLGFLRECRRSVDSCLPFEDVVKNFTWLTLDQYNCLQMGCRQLNEIVVASDSRLFKNRYCAACNGFDSESFSCQPPGNAESVFRKPSSFVMLMDFTSSGSVMLKSRDMSSPVSLSKSCPVGEVYDFHDERCRKLVCLSTVGNQQCHSKSARIELILAANVSSEQLSQDFNITDLIDAIEMLISDSIDEIDFRIIPRNRISITFTVNDLLNETFFLNKSFNVSGVNFQIVSNSDVSDLDCPVIVLNATEFAKHPNGTVVEHATNRTLSPNDYRLLPDGRIARCNVEYTRNYTVLQNATFVAWDTTSPVVILSLIGSILNIVSCLVVFVTYASIKSLRTVPGLNLMNLTAAIGLAHFFLVVGAGRVENEATCTTMAFLLHYFFLSTFTWSAAMAYDLLKTFVFEKGTSRLNLLSRRHFYVTFGFSWGIPFVFCALCLALDETDVVDIRYGTDVVCWIGNSTALLVIFVIPVAVVVVFNAVAFVAVIITVNKGIEKSYSLQSISNDIGNVKVKKSRKKVAVVGSVFCLLGLTWLFALLAAAEETHLFWYPFVVCTALQGVLIFVFYVLKTKVRKAVKRRVSEILGHIKDDSTGKGTVQEGRSHNRAALTFRRSVSTDSVIKFDSIRTVSGWLLAFVQREGIRRN